MTEYTTPFRDVLATLPLSHATTTLEDYRDHSLILRDWLARFDDLLVGVPTPTLAASGTL